MESVEKQMRETFPHGHPEFLPTVLAQLKLHSEKNHDYASGGKPTGNFDRVSATLKLYPKLNIADPRVVALVYMMKQLDAVLWGLNENIEHKVEGLNGRLDDIAVYANIVQCMNKDLMRQPNAQPRQIRITTHTAAWDAHEEHMQALREMMDQRALQKQQKLPEPKEWR
jgi:hypothetical protein